MRNALGAIQSLLVLGGSSDIGAAIAERLVPGGCRSIVLAGRHPEAMEPVAERLRVAGAEVAVTSWDATDISGHADAMKAAWAALPAVRSAAANGAGQASNGDATDGGDIDCVLLAAGVLGDQEHLEDDPAAAADLAAAGGAGLITPDLIPDEAQEWRAAAVEHGVAPIFLVAPSSTDERLAMTVQACDGFVYVASTMGVTGAREEVGDGARRLVERTRAVTDLPLCVGLGVSTRAQAAQIAGYADGVIVGSALVRAIAEDPGLDVLRHLTRELAEGVRGR